MTLLVADDGSTDDRGIALAINQTIKGKINSVGTVTLTANVASTTVNNALVSSSSVVLLMPQTANAAAALATTYIKPADTVNGTSFKITHANNAQTDRVFNYCILG